MICDANMAQTLKYLCTQLQIISKGLGLCGDNAYHVMLMIYDPYYNI